uniref:Soloist n=1 Tax=Bryum argenteum TaxID=37413 RepID=A0A4Y5TAG9_9BRYO|nr:soloist [Bryum argenteum]
MVSIRKRRHGGLSPDKTSAPQVYRRSAYPRPAGVSTATLSTNKETPLKQDASTRFRFAASPPQIPSLQELHQLYHASFPEGGKELKKRKRQKRKHRENQEPCVMRGVYFKNMKWQAAIKVEKKQVHLGTVDSQEEAARLYDRAAYLCGREPNFELTEAEKQELQLLQWEDFLEQTRQSILSKKRKRSNRSAEAASSKAALKCSS